MDENEMALVWAGHFNQPVRTDDDFFDLGGTSLLAIDLIGDISDRAGVLCDIDLLFDNPSPKELAGAVQRLQRLRPPT